MIAKSVLPHLTIIVFGLIIVLVKKTGQFSLFTLYFSYFKLSIRW